MDTNARITAWNQWMGTKSGRSYAKLGRSSDEAMEESLSQAFYAGCEAQLAAEEQAEPQFEFLDALLRTVADGPPKDAPGKVVHRAAGDLVVAMVQVAMASADYIKAHAPTGASAESPPAKTP